MSIKDRISRLERAAGQTSNVCLCPSGPDWPDDISALARESLEGCPQCRLPIIPFDQQPEFLRKVEAAYGGLTNEAV